MFPTAIESCWCKGLSNLSKVHLIHEQNLDLLFFAWFYSWQKIIKNKNVNFCIFCLL